MKRILALLLAVLCLTGCGAPKAEPEPVEEEEDFVSDFLAPAEEEENIDFFKSEHNYLPPEEPATDVPPSERISLSLGGVDIPLGFQEIVNGFNRCNPRYYVVLTDYAYQSEDLDAGVKILQTKLMSGDFPDMLYFSYDHRYDVNYGDFLLSPLSLISKDLLLDLDPLLEADPDVAREDIAGWNALHQYGGLYLLSPRAEAITLQCNEAVFGDRTGWTIDEYLEREADLEPGQHMCYYIDPEYFLVSVGGRYVRQALDIRNGTCDFDNPDFIAILEAAARIGSYHYADDLSAVGNDGSFKQASKLLEDQDVLLATGGGEPEWIAFDRSWIKEDTRLSYIGWPTVDGGCGSDLMLTVPVGACASTKDPQGCWEFLKYVLTHPLTSGDNAPLPLYIPAAEEDRKVYNSLQGNKHPMIQSDIDASVALHNQCESLAFYDESILDIILEEAEWFLKGDATAKEVAAKVQSRASLYAAEQYG